MMWPRFLTREIVPEPRVFTNEQLFGLVAERLGDTDSLNLVNEEEEQKVYHALASVDGLVDVLRDTMVKDMRRYFAIPNGPDGDRDREVIRGGFARTAHWMAKIMKIKE